MSFMLFQLEELIQNQLKNLTNIYSTNTRTRTHCLYHKTSRIGWKEKCRDEVGMDKNIYHRFSFAIVLESCIAFSIHTRPFDLRVCVCMRFVCFWFPLFDVVSCAKLFGLFSTHANTHRHCLSLSHWHTEMRATEVQIKCAVAFYSLWFDLICFRSLCEFLRVFVLECWLRLFPSSVRSICFLFLHFNSICIR